MNLRGVMTIYNAEMARTARTILQSVVSPVISTSLYFVVFGSAIGSRITEIEGISYGAFLVPGLIMLTVLTNSVSNAAFGIYFPKFLGNIYELFSAPLSFLEIVLGFVGAAATKSFVLALIILATASMFVDLQIAHPFWMLLILFLTCVSFSLFGFIIGIWARNFEQLQLVPLLIITPLVFLGGSFYAINMLPPLWQKISMFNPVLYIVSGFRWSFYDAGDVSLGASLGMIVLFTATCLGIVWWIFKNRLSHQAVEHATVPDTSTLLTFLAASIAIIAVPGPTVTVIIANSLRAGVSAGMMNVLGTQVGLALMMLGLALGLGAILSTLQIVFDVIRIVGALYLILLGIRLWRSDGSLGDAAADDAPERTMSGYFWQGFAVIWANPKALLVFGAFIPQFINPDESAVTQSLILGGIFMVTGLIMDAAYAIAAGKAGRWLSRKNVRLIERISGTCLIAGGAWLLALKHL